MRQGILRLKGFCTLQRFWALIIWDCRDIEHASKGFCAKIFWAIPKIRLIFSLILQINPPQVNPPQVNLPQVNPPQVNSPQVNHPKCKPPKCNLPAGQSSCRSIFPQVNPPQIKLPKWNLPKFKTLKCNPPWAHFYTLYELFVGLSCQWIFCIISFESWKEKLSSMIKCFLTFQTSTKFSKF